MSELPPYRVRHLMQLDRRHDVTCKLLERVVAAVKESTGIVHNTVDALERRQLVKPRKDFTTRVFHIGPVHQFFPAAAAESSLLRQDLSFLKWLC